MLLDRLPFTLLTTLDTQDMTARVCVIRLILMLKKTDPIDTATRSQIPDGCDIRRELLIETLSLDKPGGIIIYMNWGI